MIVLNLGVSVQYSLVGKLLSPILKALSLAYQGNPTSLRVEGLVHDLRCDIDPYSSSNDVFDIIQTFEALDKSRCSLLGGHMVFLILKAVCNRDKYGIIKALVLVMGKGS
jgi:hypothetical protein